jgi:predicted transcriptional regulator
MLILQVIAVVICTSQDSRAFATQSATARSIKGIGYVDRFALNNRGQIAFTVYYGNRSQLYFWDGVTIDELPMGADVMEISLNDEGQIAWIDHKMGQVLFWDGSDVVHVSQGSELHPPEHVGLNNQGCVVWMAGGDGESSMDIYYWDGVNASRLTDNDVADLAPQLNDNGLVTWSGLVGNDLEIFLWNGTETRQVTDNYWDDKWPCINADGAVSWVGYCPIYASGIYDPHNTSGDTIIGYGDEIFMQESQTISQLTSNNCGRFLTMCGIGDDGEVVFVGNGSQSVYLWTGNDVATVSDNLNMYTTPSMNDVGSVVWTEAMCDASTWYANHTHNGIPIPFRIMLYENGSTRTITRDVIRGGPTPQINNAKQIVWCAFNITASTDDSPVYEIMIANYTIHGYDIRSIRSPPSEGQIPAGTNEQKGFDWLPFIFASVVGASTLAILSTEVGKCALLLFFLPLYTKLRKEEILDDYTRGRIHGYIQANPGEHYNAIKRALDLNNGSLTHHLSILEKDGEIKSRIDGVYKRFYPKTMIIPNGGAGELTETQKMIMAKIKETPGISQKDIATLLGISSATVNYHIERMLALKVVKRERLGMRVKYYENEENAQ